MRELNLFLLHQLVITFLTTQRKSWTGAARRFRSFDLVDKKTQKTHLYFLLEEKINSWGTAWLASVGYVKAMLSHKFTGEHSLCFVFPVKLDIYEFLLFPGPDRQLGWINGE